MRDDPVDPIDDDDEEEEPSPKRKPERKRTDAEKQTDREKEMVGYLRGIFVCSILIVVAIGLQLLMALIAILNAPAAHSRF